MSLNRNRRRTLTKTENSKLNIYYDEISAFTTELTRKVDELIYSLEDTSIFIAGRVLAAIRRYRNKMPPFSKALFEFAQVYEYSWHTPGHSGGTAFLKSPIGRAFYDYFGENLLRSDLSVSVDELGSLLDHSGPIGKSEEYAARWFGARHGFRSSSWRDDDNQGYASPGTPGDACHRGVYGYLILL